MSGGGACRWSGFEAILTGKPTLEHPNSLFLRFENKPRNHRGTQNARDPSWIRLPQSITKRTSLVVLGAQEDAALPAVVTRDLDVRQLLGPVLALNGAGYLRISQRE
jgi:hypothetical protein